MAASLRLATGGVRTLANVREIARGLPSVERAALATLSVRFKKEILPAVAQSKGVTIGKPLSGVGRASARLTSGFDDVPGDDPIAIMHKARGLWVLIDQDTRPHLIISKRQRRARRSGKAVRGAIRTPQGVRAYALHPGTKGKGIWPAAVARLESVAPAALAKAQREALVKWLRAA